MRLDDSRDDELLRQLPLPLAQLYLRALNGKNAFERHNAAFYLWEAALKLLSCVAIVQYAAQASQDAAVSEKLQNLARPSTGHWWDFLRTLVPLLAATDPEFEAVRDLLLGPARRDLARAAGLDAALRSFLDGKGDPRATVKPQELFDRLVRYRNRVFGHGAAGLHDQAFYDEMSRSLLAGLSEIFGRLDVLAGCHLIYVSDVRRQASGDWLVERFDLTGETPRRLESLEMPEQTASLLPRPQEVCLELKDRRRLALRPLLFFDFDASSFYFLNSRRQKRNAEYLCYSTGKEIERDELKNERRKFLTDILGVSVDDATMSAWAAQSRADDSTEPAAEQTDAGESIGEFQLLSEIDRGGMGVVYRAWQPSLERQVALKCTRWYGDSKTEARFHREIRALGRVEHPNVVKVFASGSYGDRWFYAMELVEGADLAKVSQRLAQSPASEIGLSEWQAAVSTACEAAKQGEKPISTSDALHSPRVAPPAPLIEQSPDRRATRGHVAQIVEVIRQAAEGAHALHEAGALHRDVKPGNIVVTPDGKRAVLIDLGLAQLADEAEGRLTRTRQFVGTLRYASPEQVLAADKLDRRSDVYSLGATLWELLTLQPLYGATDETPTPVLMDKILISADPERVRKYNLNVPEDLEAIVLKCLEKDRNRRYPSALDLAGDLRRWQCGDPVTAKLPTLRYLAAKFARRHRALISAACCGLFLICLGLAAAFWQINAARVEAIQQRKTAGNALVGEQKALKKSEESLSALQARLRQLAFSYIDLAASNHGAGRHRVGLHWSLLAYQTLSDAQSSKDDVLRQAVGRLIAGWQPAVGQSLLHDSIVSAVAFSSDGRFVVTASADGTAREWDVTTGRPIGKPLKHQGSVTSVAISPDSRTIVTGSEDRTARLWDAATGNSIGSPMRHDEFVTSVAFSPDGKRVLTRGRDEAAWLWDAATGAPVGVPFRHEEFVTSAAFSPDGRMILTGSRDNTARLWDAETGKPIGEPLRHDADVLLVAFSPDGSLIVTASEDRTARLWNVATTKLIGAPMRHEGNIAAVAFSPDGQTVLTASRDQARLWDAATTEPVGNPMVHGGDVTAVAFSPDGQTILSGSQDHKARLWDAATASIIGEPRWHDAPITAVAFSSDGRTIATSSEDHTARLWDAATEELIGEPNRDVGPFQSVAFGSDGPAALTLSRHERALLLNKATKKSVGNPMAHGDRVWSAALFSPDSRTILKPDTPTSTQLWSVATRTPVGEPMRHNDIITAAAFAPDGRKVVTGSADNTARLWDAATGKPVGEPMRHNGGIASVAFSPDGRLILTRGRDDAVRLWDAATGKAVGEPMRHDDFPTTAAFSPDGRRILTISRDQMARFWESATGKAIGNPIACGSSYGAIYSPDGRTILTREDQSVRLLDAQTLNPVGEPMRHDDRVWCMAYSPDGHTIVTGGEDRTVRRWNASTGQPLGQPIRHAGSVSTVGFSPDGRTIVTGSEDKTVRLWDTTTGKPVREPMRHEGFVTFAGFSPDGRTVMTVCLDLTVRLWPAPASVSDEPERIRLWVETSTGLYRDEAIAVQPLSFEELLQPLTLAQRAQRQDRLDALGGPPAPRAPALDWHRSEAADGEQGGDWFSAAYHLKYLIAANPDRIELRLRLAKALLKLKRYREARLEMDEAIAQDPKNVEAYRLRARADLGERDEERAVADANQVMQASPGQASTLHLGADVDAEYGRWQNAASEFGREMALSPSVTTLFSLGAVELAASDEMTFRKTCRQLMGDESGSPGLIDPVAAACLAIVRPSTQVDWAPYVASAQKLRDEQPEILAGHELLGACLLRSGRWSEAARELQTVLDSSKVGGNWSTHLFLAIAQVQLNNRASAAEHLRSADQEHQSHGSPNWFDRLRFGLLRQEASKLLAGAVAPAPARTATQPTGKKPGAVTPQLQPDKRTADKPGNR